jgi:hypothetical protein
MNFVHGYSLLVLKAARAPVLAAFSLGAITASAPKRGPFARRPDVKQVPFLGLEDSLLRFLPPLVFGVGLRPRGVLLP